VNTCKADNCDRNCFGGGYCSYHQFFRRKQGGDLFVRKAKKQAKEPRSTSKGKKIPQQSEKRKITAQIYREICQQIWDDAVNNGVNRCFFSGEKMEQREDFHHLAGRDGYLFIEEEWLVLAKRKYHTMYHSYSVDQLKSTPWYGGFLLRLMAKDQSLWDKEAKKQDKSIKINKINPTLFGDD
jgi:hypothetical protein